MNNIAYNRKVSCRPRIDILLIFLNVALNNTVPYLTGTDDINAPIVPNSAKCSTCNYANSYEPKPRIAWSPEYIRSQDWTACGLPSCFALSMLAHSYVCCAIGTAIQTFPLLGCVTCYQFKDLGTSYMIMQLRHI